MKEQVGVSLDEIAPAKATVVRLLASARAHITYAQVPGISAQTRFTAAYKAIRMLADAALNANGYRTLSSRAGHHFTAIQSLMLTVALTAGTVRVLNVSRRQRNDSEYLGDNVPESAVTERVMQTEALLAWFTRGLNVQRDAFRHILAGPDLASRSITEQGTPKRIA